MFIWDLFPFFNAYVYSYKLSFLLGLILQHPISFGMLCFHFYLSQDIFFLFPFWFFLFDPLVVQELSNSHLFVHFPAFLLLQINSFISWWLEMTLDIIYVFLNLLRLVLFPNMRSIPENVSGALEKNVYSTAVVWNVLYMSVRSFDLWCCSNLLFPYWFSVWMIYPLLRVGYDSPNYYCVDVYFSF